MSRGGQFWNGQRVEPEPKDLGGRNGPTLAEQGSRIEIRPKGLWTHEPLGPCPLLHGCVAYEARQAV